MNKIAQVFGQVNPPPGINPNTGGYGDFASGGLAAFIVNIIRLILVGAALFTVFNLATSGYAFMSAGGDSRKIADAWAKIWQSMLGLIMTVGSFVLAALISKLVFDDYTTIFDITVFGP